jgi:predicted RNA-binding Zn ribbon-like protein
MESGEFLFEADDVALDFVNTGIRTAHGPGDALAAPQRVTAWLQEAGILHPDDGRRLDRSPPAARLLLDEGRRLRQAMGEALDRWLRGAPLSASSLFAVNRCLAACPTYLEVQAEGLELAISRVGSPTDVSGYLAPLARHFVDLLVGGDPTRVRACASEDCGLWFRDTSRNGSRRWCSMARCGNRAKVAAHYRRKRAADSVAIR